MTDFELGKTYRWQSDSSDEWFTIRLDREYGTGGYEFKGTVQDKGTFYGNDDFGSWIPDSQTCVTADHLSEIEDHGTPSIRREIQPAQVAVYHHSEPTGRVTYTGPEEEVYVEEWSSFMRYRGELLNRHTAEGINLVSRDGKVLASHVESPEGKF